MQIPTISGKSANATSDGFRYRAPIYKQEKCFDLCCIPVCATINQFPDLLKTSGIQNCKQHGRGSNMIVQRCLHRAEVLGRVKGDVGVVMVWPV